MKKLLVAFVLFLSACSASGESYDAVKSTLKSPGKNETQLFIYRPDSYQLITRTPDVDINGDKACDLPNNSFFLKTTNAKDATITASLWDMPGTSRLSLKLKPGKIYYVRIATDGGKLAAGTMGAAAAGGVGAFTGSLVAEGMSAHGGPFTIDVLDKKTAAPELANLKMNLGCPS